MQLIDTDILIDHFHGNPSALEFLAQQLEGGEPLVLSVITVTEFLAGMRSGEEAKTEALLALFTLLDIDEPIARQAGAYLRQYRRSHRIDLGDALIAATANVFGASVVTRNTKHYPMTDIKIVTPYQRGT
ncbi:MAG TPA: type II toxin-antitoxin system VapC family toxin [Anaerolineae bacterium]|nr:type II toxin-antitoxin system VapC family toxin [Anaerolineae bacterium]HRV91679.1 type II toxin-antitoxin system VapC family toxin [Anaerolineae bacterium]